MIKLIARVSTKRLSGSVKIYPGKTILQEKEVTPSQSEQIVKPDTGYDGLSSVKVSGDADLKAENIKYGVSVFNVMGTYVGEDALNHELTVTPTGKDFSEVPYAGFSGISKVNVLGDANLIPENVKKGVTVYGVTGTHKGSPEYLSPLTVTPTGESFEVEPEDGDIGFSSVFVEGDPNLVPENLPRGLTIYGVKGDMLPFLSVPEEYRYYIEYCREHFYDDDYDGLMVLEFGDWIAVSFLMSDFEIKTLDPTTTEFTAIGWFTCGYTKTTGAWTAHDYTETVSPGGNYAKHIIFASRYLYYGGETVFPSSGIDDIEITSVAFINDDTACKVTLATGDVVTWTFNYDDTGEIVSATNNNGYTVNMEGL